MKKSLFFILFSILMVFMVSGCGEEPQEPTSTPQIDPKTLQGTYDITFFGTQVINPRNCQGTACSDLVLGMADLVYVSNDCAKAKELYPDIVDMKEKNQCATENDETGKPATQSAELLDGKTTIDIKDGKLNMTSRVQLNGEIMDKFAPNDKYQYTIYYPTSDLSTFKGKGVEGYNYDITGNKPSNTATKFPESPYSITKLDDGSIRIDMTLVGKTVSKPMSIDATFKVDAKTTVIMKKTKDTPEQLENDIQKPFSK